MAKRVKVKSYTVKAHDRKARSKKKTTSTGTVKKKTVSKAKPKSKDKILYIPSEKVIRVYLGSTIARAFGNVSSKDANINHPPLKRWLKVNRYDGLMKVQKPKATAKTKRKPVAKKKVSKQIKLF